MKIEHKNLIIDAGFLEYKKLKSKLWNNKENIEWRLSVIGYVLFTSIFYVVLFNPDIEITSIKKVGLLIIYYIILNIFFPIPFLLYMIFLSLITSTYDKIYAYFEKQSSIFKNFTRLESIYQSKEIELKKEIEKYVREEHKEILNLIKLHPENFDYKTTYIENYSFLKQANAAIGYVPGLNDFLDECKIKISTFSIENLTSKEFSKSINAIEVSNNYNFYKELSHNSNNSTQLINKTIDNIKIVSNKILRKERTKKINYRNDIEAKITNWDKLNKQKNEIGSIGEEIVYNYEKEKLIKLGLYDYLPLLNHVSKNNGDGAGYDILSFDDNGNQIFIEVKTTLNKEFGEFFISRNELDVMKAKDTNYCIYRVYGLEYENMKCRIEILRGYKTIIDTIDFIPETFKGKIKK